MIKKFLNSSGVVLVLSFFIALHSAQSMEENKNDKSILEAPLLSLSLYLAVTDEPISIVETVKISLIFMDGQFGTVYASDCCPFTSNTVRDKFNFYLSNETIPLRSIDSVGFKTQFIKNSDDDMIRFLYDRVKTQIFGS